MKTISVSSSVIALRADRALTPAMISTVWEISAALDEQRVPAEVGNSVWLELPSKRLRGEGARQDNVWLRECLDRLQGVKLSGETKGDPWAAVLLAEYHIQRGGSVVKLLIPPAGVYALRSPGTFAKIEQNAAHSLSGHGRKLYAILADKKRLGRPSWTFPLDELRALMGVADCQSYARFNSFRQRVLDPAVEAVNAYGTVHLKMFPVRVGRAVSSIRFEWRWKSLDEVRETDQEIERHSEARGKSQGQADAPPMIIEDHMTWWGRLSADDREAWADRIGRVMVWELPGGGRKETPRRESDIARAAYADFQKSI